MFQLRYQTGSTAMKLTEVEIEGFRSIKKNAVLRVEPNVTVVLGPNDHGKSNLIAALKFLNADETHTQSYVIASN